MWFERERLHFPFYLNMCMLHFWWLCVWPHNWVHVLFNSFSTFIQIPLFFCDACVQVYDFSFMHDFQAFPLFANVWTNTSLLLRETKSFLNLCWGQWLNITFWNIHNSTQFCVEASNAYDLDGNDMLNIPLYGCQNLLC